MKKREMADASGAAGSHSTILRLILSASEAANAAARANGMSYSKFMYGLKKANVELNRKVLADIAVNDAQSFAKLVETAKASL